MSRNAIAIMSAAAIALSLGACSQGVSAPGAGSTGAAEASVRVPYDPAKVDEKVAKAGKRVMDDTDAYVEAYKKQEAASGDTRMELATKTRSKLEALSKSLEKLNKVYDAKDDWNTDTQQYYIDLMAYESERAVQVRPATSDDGSYS